MKLLVSVVFGLLPPFAFAQTAMIVAKQTSAPAQLTRAVHGIPEALKEAWLENRSDKPIVGYRVGWINVESGHSILHESSWNSLENRIDPGATAPVPAQGIGIDEAARQMVFLVAEIRFADGSVWKAPEVLASEASAGD